MNRKSDGALLTSSGVADLLGVHSSTVKRWCDEGTLISEKTPGGHRRIRLGDALDTARGQDIHTFLDFFHPWEANVWLAVSEAEEQGSYRRLHNLALGWLSQGETDLVARLFVEVAKRPRVPFPKFLDDGIRTFMVRVGEEWQEGRLAVGEEHMASQIVMESLLRLRTTWEPSGPVRPQSQDPLPVAVVGAMEGDHHDLGALAVRVLLEREGWKVYYLGADVPVEEFAEIQRAQGASLVCISFSPKNSLPDLQRAVRVLEEFYRPQYPYFLGLGGSLTGISDQSVPTGPFLDRSISRSAQELLLWIRTLREKTDTQDPRRVT
jgi:excisionase family DNA binding protein